MDTYAAETASADRIPHWQLIATVQRELDKLAARVESDAVALATIDGDTLAASGRLGSAWSHDQADAQLAPADADPDGEAVLEAGGTLFRVIRIPLTLDDGATSAGWIRATPWTLHYAEMLDSMSRARTPSFTTRCLSPAPSQPARLAISRRRFASRRPDPSR